MLLNAQDILVLSRNIYMEFDSDTVHHNVQPILSDIICKAVSIGSEHADIILRV